MKVIIQNARLAFPSLFTADEKFGNYGGQFLVEPDSKAVAKMEAAIEQVAKEKWGAKAEATLKGIRAKNNICMYSGDLKADYDGFEGMVAISAGNPKRPTVVDRAKNPTTESDGLVYAGCYVNVILDVWAQDNEWGKRINAKLLGVQFFKDGDSFGSGATVSEDDFDDLSAEDEDDASDFT